MTDRRAYEGAEPGTARNNYRKTRFRVFVEFKRVVASWRGEEGELRDVGRRRDVQCYEAMETIHSGILPEFRGSVCGPFTRA